MFGFPVNLQDSGVQKFTNDADSGFPKIQQREVFYSVKDGDWLDATIWQTASGRVGMIPGANDDVYIKNIVKIQFLHPLYPSGDYYCNNFFVSGTFNLFNFRLNVYGNFKNVGVVNSGLGTGFFSELKLYGVENVLGAINQNNWTNINFARDGVQYIPSYNYYRLTTSGLGTKYLTSNTIVLENLICSDILQVPYIGGIVNLSDDKLPIFECAGYELEVYGQTLIRQWSIFKQSGSGRLLFHGFVGVGYSLQFAGGFRLSGNPNVECQNEFYVSYDINLGYGTRGGFYSGTGTWRFTTNNQTIWTNTNSSAYLTFDSPISIASGITLTHHNSASVGNTILNLNNTINGESSTSTFINRGIVNFNTVASVPSMTTGIWDFTTNANTIGYTGNYTATIPSYFTTFHNLTISGTGTKSLGVNTTLNGNLTSSGCFELSTYNLVVNGASTINPQNTTVYPLQKSGSGSVTFVGLVTFGNGFVTFKSLDFSIGNPTVELRGGMSFTQQSVSTFKTGTGTWSFTTNNQNITNAAASSTIQFDCSVLISGAISLSQVNSSTTAFSVTYVSTINGNNASSQFVMGSVSTGVNTATYNSATKPMATGILDTSTNLNTWIYGNANQDILGGPTTGAKQVYRNLTLNGGGTKTLQGYVSVLNTYTLTSPATLNNNGFTLTNP